MRKSLLALGLSLMTAVTASAYSVEVDGVYYNLLPDLQTAEVTDDGEGAGGCYSGDVVIAPTVTSEGVEYTVDRIVELAFEDCAGLKSVVIPETVKVIGEAAFKNCTSLATVKILGCVEEIDENAFENCSSLSTFVLFNPNPDDILMDGPVFTGTTPTDWNVSFWVPASSVKSYQNSTDWPFEIVYALPFDFFAKNADGKNIYYAVNTGSAANKSVLVESGQFPEAYYAGDVVIPDEVSYNGTTYVVSTIDDGAFYQNINLTAVTIPASVTSIGNQAFRDCSSLRSVTINGAVEKIGAWAFAYCGIRNFKIMNPSPSSMSIDSSLFDHTSIGYATLYVPEGSIYSYAVKSPWNGFYDIENADFDPEKVFRYSGVYYYNLDENSVYVTYNHAPDRVLYRDDVVIPAKVYNEGVEYTVTQIGKNAFKKCTGLTSVAVAETVTAVGDNAFSGCTGMKQVQLYGCVNEIGDGAFADCTSLIHFQILNPDSDDITMGQDVFDGTPTDDYNVSLWVPYGSMNSYRDNSEWPFVCTYELDFNFRAQTEDGSYLYYCINEDATGDKSVSVVNGMWKNTSIYGDLFIPAEVTDNGVTYVVNEISQAAFKQSENMFGLVIPKTVRVISDQAFMECTNLASVQITGPVEQIRIWAFSKCHLNRFEINNPDPTSINTDKMAFENSTTSSATLVVPAGSINSYKAIAPWDSFGTYEEIETFDVFESDGYYFYLDGSNNAILTYDSESGTQYRGEVVIPTTANYEGIDYPVTAIGEKAFRNCTDLKSVTIPECITSIGKFAFEGCDAMKFVYILGAPEEILEGAFFGCTDISYFIIHADDPDNISMRDDVFAEETCNNACLMVPKGCVQTYRDARKWDEFANVQEFPFDFKAVDAEGETFYYNYNDDAVSVSLASGYLGFNSYSGDVTVPANVAYDSVKYPVTEIGYKAFYDCPALTSVTIPETVTTIGSSAFENSEALTSMEIPESVMTIADNAFCGCTAMESVRVLSFVKEIGEKAFGDCTSLKKFWMYNTDAATINASVEAFGGTPTGEAVLYVPLEGIDTYTDRAPWNSFMSIRSIDESGVENLGSDVNSDVNNDVYYDLTGRRILNPAKGLYIHNGRKVVVK